MLRKIDPKSNHIFRKILFCQRMTVYSLSASSNCSKSKKMCFCFHKKGLVGAMPIKLTSIDWPGNKEQMLHAYRSQMTRIQLGKREKSWSLCWEKYCFLVEFWVYPRNFWQKHKIFTFPSIKEDCIVKLSQNYPQSIDLILGNKFYMYEKFVGRIDATENWSKVESYFSKNAFLVTEWLYTHFQ